jgi:hypothetical protein
LNGTVTSTCAAPTALAFVQQPTNVAQSAVMSPAVTVKAYCTSSGATAANYTGNITLTASGGGCGYTSQTVAAVNGVATFNNISFSRSTQTGITLTASAASLTSVVSNSFDVTAPSGTSSNTTLKNDNFSGSSPSWGYSVSSTSVGSGGTSGSDVTGVVTYNGNSYLRKSYSADNGSSQLGSATTITFANVTGLASYNSVTFGFKLASLNQSGTATACTGCGIDTPDYLYIETSTDGGSSWSRLTSHVGSGDRLFGFGSTVENLSVGVNALYPSPSLQSAFSVLLPSGTSQFQFRMIARNNRLGENLCIDDITLVGTTLSGTVASSLPSVTVAGSANICSGNSAILSSSVSNATGTVTYAWSPSTGLDNSTDHMPTATLSSTQAYTLTVTDADNCAVPSSNSVTISVDLGSSPVGDWLGTYSTDWFDCRNWKGKSVPSATTDVTIPTGASTMPEIVQAGALCKNLTIQSAATLTVFDPSSTLEVYGNYTNSNSLSHTSGVIKLIGADQQTIDCGASSSPFYNLEINNSSAAGILLATNNMNVSNQLSLTKGNITLGTNNLIIASTGSILGGSSTSFVKTNSTGGLKQLATGSGARLFPVGINTYNPVTLTNSGTSDNFTVRVATGILDNGTTGVAVKSKHNVNRTWFIEEDVAGGSNATVTLGWNTVDESTDFIRGQAYISHYTNNSWDNPNAIATTTTITEASFSISRSGITSFSPWAVSDNVQPLPIELLSFTATYTSNHVVELKWATATEINNDYFTIERSTDAINFKSIYKTPGAGNSTQTLNYQAVDDAPLKGVSYYRLKQTDFDGKTTYSQSETVSIQEDFSIQSLYPNPATNQLNIAINQLQEGLVELSIVDVIGQVVYKEDKHLTIQKNILNIDLSNLPSGMYILMINGSRSAYQNKFIKH